MQVIRNNKKRKLLVIRLCTADDISAIINIVYEIWNLELPDYSVELKRQIYSFLVDYYFIDPALSFVYTENGSVKAFLFAANKAMLKQKHDLGIKNSCEKQNLHEEQFCLYKKYIQTNCNTVYDVMNDNDVCIGLFASNRRGSGSILLEHFERECIKIGCSHIILWTDETCNVSYYYRNNFVDIMHFKTASFLPEQKLATVIFEKQLKSV